MPLLFFGKNNPSDQCPSVHRDPDTGSFYFQGDLVTDPVRLAEITANSPMLSREAVVELPPTMAAIIMEAARDYLAGHPVVQRPVERRPDVGAETRTA